MQTLKSRLESPKPKWRDTPQLWNLRRACINNAIELLKEARILYKHRRYPRAFVLAYTAYEEFGKGQLVSDFITGVASEEEFWKSFRSHDLKSSYNQRKIVVHIDNASPPTVEYDENNVKSLFKMRMDSLYVDCADDFTPLTPKKRINAEAAKETIEGVDKYISHVLWAEKFNERIGTESLAR